MVQEFFFTDVSRCCRGRREILTVVCRLVGRGGGGTGSVWLASTTSPLPRPPLLSSALVPSRLPALLASASIARQAGHIIASMLICFYSIYFCHMYNSYISHIDNICLFFHLSILGRWRTSVKALRSYSSTDQVSSMSRGKFLKMEATIVVRFQ